MEFFIDIHTHIYIDNAQNVYVCGVAPGFIMCWENFYENLQLEEVLSGRYSAQRSGAKHRNCQRLSEHVHLEPGGAVPGVVLLNHPQATGKPQEILYENSGLWWLNGMLLDLPSGKQPHSYEQSPFFSG